MELVDVISIKNRIGNIIEHEKDEIIELEDLIIYCENVGGINTAQYLKNKLKNEKEELDDLTELRGRFEQEERRLIAISPEVRYPAVSEGGGGMTYAREPNREYRARDNPVRY